MLDSDCLVFIEVRCRMSSAFAHPALTIDRHKQRKIVRTAAMFAAAHPRLALHTMRFDVVAIQGQNECNISWVRDAFRPDDSAF